MHPHSKSMRLLGTFSVIYLVTSLKQFFRLLLFDLFGHVRTRAYNSIFFSSFRPFLVRSNLLKKLSLSARKTCTPLIATDACRRRRINTMAHDPCVFCRPENYAMESVTFDDDHEQAKAEKAARTGPNGEVKHARSKMAAKRPWWQEDWYAK